MHRTVWATDASYWLRGILTYLSPENKKPQRSRLIMSVKHVPFGISVSSAPADKFGTWNKWYWRSFPSFLKPLAGARSQADEPYFLQGSWLVLLWRVVDQALRRHRVQWFTNSTARELQVVLGCRVSSQSQPPVPKLKWIPHNDRGLEMSCSPKILSWAFCTVFPFISLPSLEWLRKQTTTQTTQQAYQESHLKLIIH